MRIEIFSSSSKIQECFKIIEKTKEFHVSYFPVNNLKKILKNTEPGTIVYVDIADFTRRERESTLKYLSKHTDFSYGIIDKKEVINDISELYYNNAVDYIGKSIFKEGVSSKRIKKTVNYIERLSGIKHAKGNKSEAKKIGFSGRDWKSIRPGNEYTFCMMFIELDHQKKIKEKYSSKKLKEFTDAFHDDVTELISEVNGKLWIWSDFGGVILIPFDGEKCHAVITCFELILNRNIISVKDYNYNTILSYRIALHIDNSVYKTRGKTGSIVSDSINSIFHLGNQYAEPGEYLLTEKMFEFVPEGLQKFFTDKGEFEGRKIKKMITPA